MMTKSENLDSGDKVTKTGATGTKPGPKAKTKVKTKKAVPSATLKQSSAASAVEPAPTRSTSSPEERYRMIQDAAYHIAERDGFQKGKEQDYWLRAEKEIDEMSH